MSYIDPRTDVNYKCPNCGNIVTYWGAKGRNRRDPDTLKCGKCRMRFDWRDCEVISSSDDDSDDDDDHDDYRTSCEDEYRAYYGTDCPGSCSECLI